MRIVLTEVTPGAAEGVRATLSALDDIEVVGYPRDGLEAAQMAVKLKPDVMLIHDQMAGISGTAACQLASIAAPGVACALLCDGNDAETRCRAMRAGARAVITPHTRPDEFVGIIKDLAKVAAIRHTKDYQLVTDPSAMPQTIVLAAARDGVGKSTLSTNLAACLAKRHPGQVALVDLSGQFGSLGLLMNVKPAGTIIDLAGFISEMDAELVDAFLASSPCGVKVLAGGDTPDPAWSDALSVDFIASLLGILRRSYRFVVCEIPTTIWPGGLYAISRAQKCLLVTSLSQVTELKETASLLDLLVPDYLPRDRVKLVVNRTRERDWFNDEDAHRATGLKVWHKVPCDSQHVFAAANDGEPIVLAKPSVAVSGSLDAMCKKLLEELRQT